ncbi:PadR family transcriptional regulator [Saccharopolyspora thermophila]|uniref:PadR family transcriptional regulator n=1 Tax=Saccharopolyspora thermophila TaxID=89367 RepID=UPI00166DA441|nr:PadR family transcriptional regulator [Saccharopolyspora subtropica]
MDLTPAELTILGLVIERPRHGYDLERVIEERGIRAWTELGFSSIYYVLNKLQAKGYVAAEPGRSSRSRRVYTATAAGRQSATQAVIAAISDVTPLRPPLLAGLANLPLLTNSQVAAALDERREQLDQRIRSVQAARQAQQPLPPFVESIFEYSLSLLQAERQWLDTSSPTGTRHDAED